MTPPLLSLADVTVRYGAHEAVSGISFAVAPGEIVGLVGESGSGKTTIGRAIAGTTPVSRGDVRWEGRALPSRRSPQERRAIQVVFQDPSLSLNPRLTVGTMLAELLVVHRIAPRREVRQRVEELLARVSLPPETADARPARLSGGQRQRVAIARALAVQPRLIVADEPTSALDVSVQADILRLFARTRDELGTSIVIVTHDIGVVRYLCDRVVVLQGGRIVEQGPTREVLASPREDYTRALLSAVPRLSVHPTSENPALS
ncbi:ATP-binding cassette domain-containing protein [Microbacterium betulae]|uniref:ATP-binding cassette domain-containing protein n=1 Tax=Microbacterium betulae TaxID=2981139 RepID=A0AA97FHS3_9MICO|nr:ATP-binding cassette domain-containing protein [Microbacterium sp. AB]WOF23486.1 ATP-binding cassette domain-containing protein [Microbacterium sp. AB]